MKKRKKKNWLNLFENEIVQLITTLAVYEFIKWYTIEFAIKLFR